MRRRLAAVVLLVSIAVVSFIALQRYTAYGIFLAGGSRYWVHRAVNARSDSEASAHLYRVVHATQYGVNAAENAVKRLPKRSDRTRMWRILIGIAPNENWRDIYRHNLAREGSEQTAA